VFNGNEREVCEDAKQRMKETATNEELGAAWHACGAPFPYPLALFRPSGHIPGQELLENPISSVRVC